MTAVVCRSTSPEQTQAIAGAIARALVGGDVVVLAGDLGAGKTCFVQGVARARGVTDRVTSPTFVIARSYTGDIRIVHIDVYRLNDLGELDDLGHEELFADDTLTFIEWGDAVAGRLPPHTTIRITADGEERTLSIEGARAADLAAATQEWRA